VVELNFLSFLHPTQGETKQSLSQTVAFTPGGIIALCIEQEA